MRSVSYTHLDVYKRQVLVAASIVAVCLGGLLGAFAWTATSDTRSVVAVRSAVERGAVIGREDLMACLLYTSRCV